MISPYEELANAIVLQAAKDYRQALKKGHCQIQAGIERFFRSGWFGELTSLNAEYLIRRVNEEVQRNDR